MSETNEPHKTDAKNQEAELSEEALNQVSGGRRTLEPSRKDIEIEGDSRFDPRVVKKPTQIVDL